MGVLRQAAWGLGIAALALPTAGVLAYVRIRAWDRSANQIINGAWRAHDERAMQEDRLTIAQISVYALFALKQSEVIYFLAYVDDEGKSLDSANKYRIFGPDIDARYWSITVYDKEDALLIANDEGRYAFNKWNVPHDADGSFSFELGGGARGPNALPTGSKSQGLILALRVYHPSESLRRTIRTFQAPRIVRVTP